MSGIKLPKAKVKAVNTNPKTMVLFSHPKTGKTEAFAGLENSIILDLEKGSGFVDAVKLDIIAEAAEAKTTPITQLMLTLKAIKEENDKAGKFVYRFGILDTVTALEDLVKPYAADLHRKTTQGKNWKGTDILTLAKGMGYMYIREAMQKVINMAELVFETVIIAGHVKDKDIQKEGEDVTERCLALAGKLPAILCSKVDAVGFMFRRENKTIIDFKTSESLLVGTRCKHITNKQVTVITSDDKNNLTVDWSEVFKD